MIWPFKKSNNLERKKKAPLLTMAMLTALLSSSTPNNNPEKNHLTVPEKLREAIYLSIDPYGYSSYSLQHLNIIAILKKKMAEFEYTVKHNFEHSSLSGVRNQEHLKSTKQRLDAWRIYLQLPQLYDSFSKSDYKPSKSKSLNVTYFKINNFISTFNHISSMRRVADKNWIIKFFLSCLNGKDAVVINDSFFSVMGDFTLSKGNDSKGYYISYYDKWDLDGDLIEGESGLIGKPFEIYDRIYYNPETFEPIENFINTP